MTTRCVNGALFDEAGICGCGSAHEDPAAQADDLARLRGQRDTNSCATICPGCGKPLEDERYDHRACLAGAVEGAKPN